MGQSSTVNQHCRSQNYEQVKHRKCRTRKGQHMTKQIEATLTSNRGKVYRQIAEVFDSLPDRFTATELYKAAKLESTHTMQRRALIASVMVDAFKCVSVRSDDGRGRHWKKPGATHDKR